MGLHFAIDIVLVWLAFFLATVIRFQYGWDEKWTVYYPGVVLGALLMPSVAYIFGLYSTMNSVTTLRRRMFLVVVSQILAMCVIVLTYYLTFQLGIGRGVMALSLLCMCLLIVLHHLWIHLTMRFRKERVVFLVGSEEDEMEACLLDSFGSNLLEYMGLIPKDGYLPKNPDVVLCKFSDIEATLEHLRIDRVACTSTTMADPKVAQMLCRLRYSGTSVVSLVSLFEEIHQFVPVELVDSGWLLAASGSPEMFYIRKIKRIFDVAVALAGLIALGPFLLLGMLAVRLTSSGTVFYRQVRVGRFGKDFTVIKLRTMRMNAESDGAKWAQSDDSRVTPVGNLLRKYRIDEIPQLLNVLKGEMSFVGPRPERPEFNDIIAAEVPYFRERLLVQPGITGWAQVRFPYGSSIDDARCKLAFDLYYTKHMSIFLDLFILLDTVKIVLVGGLSQKAQREGNALDAALAKLRTTTPPIRSRA